MSDNNIYKRPGRMFFQSLVVDGRTDAFGRQRNGLPYTLLDSKLNIASHTLFWNDAEISGGGTSSTYSADESSYTLAVSASTAGTRVRQSKLRTNYQPGKSQFLGITGVLGAGEAGIRRRLGLFDENNGLFFEQDGETLKVVVRSSVSGSPVDTAVTQANWEYDTMDGTGTSGVTLDLTKAQIFFFDFESLQVGTVRFGFYIDGTQVYVHAFDHANVIPTTYLSTPNLPVRYELSNDGTGGAATMKAFCSTVISEGGSEETGITRYVSTNGVGVGTTTADVTYAVVGVRLKNTALDNVVKIAQVSLFAETNDNFEWLLILNPTVADTFTYSDLADSAIQFATGAGANTVTGGTTLAGGWSASSSAVSELVNSLYYIGSTIGGTSDEIVLCVRPLALNATIQGGITIKEIA